MVDANPSLFTPGGYASMDLLLGQATWAVASLSFPLNYFVTPGSHLFLPWAAFS